MNILMVIDVLSFEPTGGAEVTFHQIAKSLVKRGHEVHVISRRLEELPNVEVAEGAHFHTYYVTRRNILLFIFSSIFRPYRLFKKLASKISFDVMNIHHSFGAVGINLSRKSRQIAEVYLLQAPWHREYEIQVEMKKVNVLAGFKYLKFLWDRVNSCVRRRVERNCLKRCQKIIVLSHYMKQELMKAHGIDEKDIAVIPGGVDRQTFRPTQDKAQIRDKLNLPKDKFIILTARRLVPRMGLDNLIRAMTTVSSKIKDVYLVIAGEGKLRPRLESLTRALNLQDYVRFAGSLEHSTVLPLYYQAADLFVLPTKKLEGFGFATLEALSSGIPVLGTPIGGTKEILGKFNDRLLFKGTDSDSLAELILKFKKLSPEELKDLGKQAREFVTKNYSWDVIVSQWEEIFLDAKD